MSKTRIFIGVIAAGAAASPLAAQSTGVNGLQINATVGVIYDSNELRAPDGFTSGNNDGRDGVRYTPALSAGYRRNVGRFPVSLDALIGRDIYQQNNQLSRNRYSAGIGVGYTIGSRCSGNIDADLSIRQSGARDGFLFDPVVPGVDGELIDDPGINPDVDPDIDDDVGIVIDNRQTVTSYGIDISCGRGGLSFGGSANHSGRRNGASARDFGDNDRDSYSVFIGAGILRPGQLQLVGSYSTIDYPNRLFAPGSPAIVLNGGVDTYSVGLNYSRPIGTRLSGSIGASYLTARPDNAPKYSSPSYNVSLSYRPSTRLSLGLNGARGINSSNNVGALYRVTDSVNLSAFYQVSPTISARASTGLSRNNFRQSFAIPGEPVLRQSQTTTRVDAGLTYVPRPRYDISANIGQTFRTSNPSVFDYESTRASITLAVHF